MRSIFVRSPEDRFRKEILCHTNAAFNLARWLLGDEQDAEDAVQDAMIRAFEAFTTLRADDARSWFLSIVRNGCMNKIRSRNRLGQRYQPIDDESLHIADPVPGPSETLLRSVDGERIRSAIEALPPEYRAVVVLREMEDMSYKEIAVVTGTPIGTVMSRLSRARTHLQRALGDRTCNEE